MTKPEEFHALRHELDHLTDSHGMEEMDHHKMVSMVHAEAHRLESSSSVEGIVRWSRSDSSDCICCDGNHVYGRSVELIAVPERTSQIRNNLDEWVHTQFYNAPEGARLRFTVEVLDDPSEAIDPVPTQAERG